MLIGRQNELRKLDSIYNSDKFECVIVHGRRRSGKTALLREFMAGKKAVYFSAQETCSIDNFENLAACISIGLREPIPSEMRLDNFEDIITYIGSLAYSERILLIIDEYQFLVSGVRGISNLICKQIDESVGKSKLMLIICGSSEPLMDSETLGYNCPFHGRRTAQINVEPFSFFETKRLYTAFSPFDIAIVYGLTGGVPKYLELMNPELTIEDNVRKNFFDTSAFLFEEPSNILRREIRDPTYYNAILRAVSIGLTKNSEIASAVGLETSACTAYLKNLMALGLIGKYTPVTEKAGKKTIYEIEDNMFRFWYRFVHGNMSLIQSGMAERIWRSVAREMSSFMGKVFEDICRQWLTSRNEADRLPIKFVEMGRWWGVDPVWKSNTSIPIIAYADDNSAIFADCEWSEEPTKIAALNSLFERSRLFRFTNRYLYMFSRSGFSDECTEAARRIGANLVLFE